jgi:hypothetical protein
MAEDVVDHLRPYIRGWKAYFRLAQTPLVWRELDQWLRHRLRAIRREVKPTRLTRTSGLNETHVLF